MKLAVLPPRRDAPKQLGMIDQPERIPTQAELDILREIQARLSGLGEPPQFGNRITLKDIQNAIRMSELGETYYLFALIRDMIENDSHIQAESGKRVMSFIGQEERIEACDKNNPDDQLAAEVIEDMIANCPNWMEGCVHLAQGHLWPVAACEKIYGHVEPGDKFRHPVMWKLKKLHPIPWPLFTYKVAYWNIGMLGGSPAESLVNQGFTQGTGSIPINNPPGAVAYHAGKTNNGNSDNSIYIWNPQDWHPDLRFYGTLSNGMIDWTLATGYKPDPIRHVIHSAQVSTSGLRPNFGGLYRSVMPLWFYKKNLLDWYMQKMERYGGPFAVGYAQMANKNVSDILTKAFNQASVLNALLVPPGTKIDLKEINASGMSDGFAKAIEVTNTEITKAILGQTLSTTSKGSGMMGGSGVADLHGEVRSEWSQYDKRAFCQMQKDQIFDCYLRLNGYRGSCKAIRGGMTPANLAVFSKSLQSLALAGVFIDESAEQDLTAAVGFKMKIKDLQAEAIKAAAKNDKSTYDRANN